MIGTVKVLNRGYGFIQDNKGYQWFFTLVGLPWEFRSKIKEGVAVSFEPKEQDELEQKSREGGRVKAPAAHKVEIIVEREAQ
jgi:hypothetical protein